MQEQGPELFGWSIAMSAFGAGENDADMAGPPITQEQLGAPTGITASLYPAGSAGVHEPLREPYLMPPYHGRNGSNERCAPSITLTPLGGLMPGPAMPPPQVDGHVGAFPLDEDNGQFQSGIIDSWPDGVPVPVRSK